MARERTCSSSYVAGLNSDIAVGNVDPRISSALKCDLVYFGRLDNYIAVTL